MPEWLHLAKPLLGLAVCMAAFAYFYAAADQAVGDPPRGAGVTLRVVHGLCVVVLALAALWMLCGAMFSLSVLLTTILEVSA